MKKGFTLIELMIVIAIIAIIAAIAIPNLLAGRVAANETSAVGGLKLITSMEAIWTQQGPDGNGIKDYWTYDVSCLHRMYRADGETKVILIPLDLARADACPADTTTDAPFGSNPLVEIWTEESGRAPIQPKSGYWFMAMRKTNLETPPAGEAAPQWYNSNIVGTTGDMYCGNHNSYGFMAAPDVYGSSGVRSFIVNEQGTIYGSDTGGKNEIGTGFGPGATMGNPQKGQDGDMPDTFPLRWTTEPNAPDVLNWPTRNPPSQKTNAGYPWAVAE